MHYKSVTTTLCRGELRFDLMNYSGGQKIFIVLLTK